jgi:mannosylglycerate hydrolase
MSDAPGNDQVITSLGKPARVSMTTQGPLVVKFVIEQEIALPAEYDWIKQARAQATRTLPIKVELTLRHGAKALEVKTTIRNTVKDHFFKVCFPTGLAAEKTWSEGSFAVAEFPVKPSTTGELRGNELARHPAQLWFDLSDGKSGLAVLSDAAKDYEVLEHVQDQTLAMSLVRSVRLRIPCDNRLWMEYPGDESAQSLDKEFTYGYALLPHAGLWDQAGLCTSALAFTAPMHVCQFGKQKGKLPLTKSFLELKGANLVLSGIKKAEERDTLIVRLYNPSGKDQDATLALGLDVKAVNLLNLNEEVQSSLKIQNKQVRFKAGKGKIITLELIPARA